MACATKDVFSFMCVDVLLSCRSVHHVCAVPGRPEECVGSEELELQIVGRHQVGAGNRTQDLLQTASDLNCGVTAP